MTTWIEGGHGLPPHTDHVYELSFAGTTLVFVNEGQVREAKEFFGKRLRPQARRTQPESTIGIPGLPDCPLAC